MILVLDCLKRLIHLMFKVLSYIVSIKIEHHVETPFCYEEFNDADDGRIKNYLRKNNEI